MIELENERRYLHQWALDQRVQIDNFLPGTWVEFSIVGDSKFTSLITEAYEECGHVFANIPNVLLQNFGYIHVYVNPVPRDMAHTPEEKDFKIVRRPKPSYYIYTETPTVSYNSKVDIFWGKEYAGKAVVVGEDGYLTASEKTFDDTVDDMIDDSIRETVDEAVDDAIDESVATEGEVDNMVDDVFNENEGTENPGTSGDDSTSDEIPDEYIAKDEDVNDMVADVFG